MKKTIGAMVKFKVAMAALTGQPITDICKQYEVSEISVHKWKKRLKEEGVCVFDRKNKKGQDQHEAELSKLYQRIGKLTTELEFLKKVAEA